MQRSALLPHYNTEEEISIITNTAKELAKTNTRYYTGHCTGVEAFDIMKKIMGDKLATIHSGETIIDE